MENERPGTDLDEILGSLHEGLRKAEEVIVSILGSVMADNATYLSELEAALTDVEAVLAGD